MEPLGSFSMAELKNKQRGPRKPRRSPRKSDDDLGSGRDGVTTSHRSTEPSCDPVFLDDPWARAQFPTVAACAPARDAWAHWRPSSCSPTSLHEASPCDAASPGTASSLPIPELAGTLPEVIVNGDVFHDGIDNDVEAACTAGTTSTSGSSSSSRTAGRWETLSSRYFDHWYRLYMTSARVDALSRRLA
mmetsp:Transcript_91542/g.258515  ORF Transcript_91542/g.258515 Transcript_91542/m.258515 type:complete len:189 (-) Transcript_91542:87-653(-)